MRFEDVRSSLSHVHAAKVESEKIFDRISSSIGSMTGPGVSIVANGSLARREITSQSDFDAYPLYGSSAEVEAKQVFSSVKAGAGLKEFSADGAFGSPVSAANLSKKIGGQEDDNRKFTQRMLLLLESVCFGSDKVYNDTLEKLLFRYISDDITDKQIGRFLLNDVIRFYRTMCVDFEFKTAEQSKPWGIRYTKLIFSRKLIYFTGVLMCAELSGRDAASKRSELRRLIGLPPVDRLLDVLGESAADALIEYDNFLGMLNDEGTRAALAEVKVVRGTHTDRFKEVKASGHRFSTALVRAFRERYPVEHPIREAVLV